MCESVVRATDTRRLARRGRKQARYWHRAEAVDDAANSEGESAEDDDAESSGAGAENEVEEDLVDVDTDVAQESRSQNRWVVVCVELVLNTRVSLVVDREAWFLIVFVRINVQ